MADVPCPSCGSTSTKLQSYFPDLTGQVRGQPPWTQLRCKSCGKSFDAKTLQEVPA